MSSSEPETFAPLDDPWARARLVAELFAVDPHGLGGVRVRSGPGASRDCFVRWIADSISPYGAVLRVPVDVSADRLLGGLSLGASLRLGRPVFEDGILAQAHGGVLVMHMAERAEVSVVSHICAALDRGALAAERDGFSKSIACRLGVVALDEGVDTECAPAPLTDRLAFGIDLADVDPRSIPTRSASRDQVDQGRAYLPEVTIDDETIEALSRAAMALGVSSIRTIVAARAHAALRGRKQVDQLDATVGAALVLAPRATRLPASSQEDVASSPGESSSAAATPPSEGPELDDGSATGEQGLSAEVFIDAVRSALPRGLLDKVNLTNHATRGPRREGRSGAKSVSSQGGRPAGARAGVPSGGARIHLLATLTAAAPWQRLRAAEAGREEARSRIRVRKSDLRVLRLQRKRETLVIFSVDASGSSAAQRLAEAKGAVEQVLAECYARRDQVALVAFRGDGALVVLPPTRSLARARKSLAGLPGGGPTPVAAGIDAAVALSLQARKAGKTPILVLMTDARANVARNGSRGSVAATSDALASARIARAEGLVSVLLDTSPRPREEARALASAMDATYLPLPYLDAAGISRQIKTLGRVAS